MARRNPYQTNTGIHIEWFTVRRSTVYTLVACILGLAAAGAWGYYRVYGPRPTPERNLTPTDPERGASFLDLSGTVKVRKAGTYEWVDANMAMALDKEDTIRTVGNSQARVSLFDGTVYVVRADSILVIEEASKDPTTKAARVEVTLETGRVNLTTPSLSEPGSRRYLATPTSGAEFDENTDAEVSFDTSTGTAGFTVFAGRSNVNAGGQQVTLTNAQAVGVSSDATFGDIIDLPGVPAIVSPAHGSRAVVSDTVEFRWRRVDGARKYHVVLDRSSHFRDPILESTVPGVSILHKGLTPGTYYWQVAAIDRDDNRGAPSDFAKFTIVTSEADTRLPPAPRLDVATPTVTIGGLVTVRGRTEVDAIVTIDRGMGDDRIEVKSDGSFTYYFEVREAGRHPVVVRARRRDGGRVAERTVYAKIGID